MANIRSFKELRVWQSAMDTAMRIFDLTKRFPNEERFSLTDQVRRSSRSVAANIAEAWRKRRYPAAFVSKLNDAEAEAAESQVWIEIALRCDYLSERDAVQLDRQYEGICGQLVAMISRPSAWIIEPSEIAKRSKQSVSDSPCPRVPASPRSSISPSPRPRVPASPRSSISPSPRPRVFAS